MNKQFWYLACCLLASVALLQFNQQSLRAKPVAQSTSAEYRITFTSEWSEETHPNDFPSDNPHFSGLIGGTHNDSVSFWAPGEMASPGIEEMAETGGTGTLDDEVQDAIEAGTAGRVLAGGGIDRNSTSQTMEIFITSDYPMVTLVSMIAPSPDWFVGVHGQSLLNNQGDWIETLTVDLLPYDAGTDSGTTYRSGNDDTDPAEPISNLQGQFPFSSARIGTFTFERINGPDNPTATPEDTPTPAPTDTPTPVPTDTPTPLPTDTPTPVPTNTPTPLPTDTPTPLPTDSPTTVPTPEPSIAILSPEDNADVTLPFTLSVDIQNWPLEPNGRHYHWYVDGTLMGPIYDSTSVSVSDLDPGTHTLVVELSEANHDTINISDTVTINVIAAMTDPTSQPTTEPTATPSPTDAPTGAQSTDATFQITFDSTWSSETHPGDGTFPSSSAHYSPLIGATHNNTVSLWAPGGMATDGIELMAETGGTSTLRTEIQALIDAGSADQIVSGGGLSVSPGMLSTNVFTVSGEYPLLSLVTMIAPSPDWFVGIHDLSLVDENGEWKSEITATLDPYDAGTDDGPAYVSSNADSDPQQPITNLKGQAPFSDASLGSFTITLMGTTPREGTTPVPADTPAAELNEKVFLPFMD